VNNSATQGDWFYQQLSQSSFGTNFYGVNAVTGCQDPEGVGEGTPPSDWISRLQIAGIQVTGANAVAYDMYYPLWQGRCTKRH